MKDILRTPHLPLLTSPAFLCNILRISLFSSLSFTSFKCTNPLTSFSPQLPFLPKTSLPISPSLPSPTSKWAPPMGGNLRSGRTGSFSVGSNGGESKEILVQHLLVGEDNLRLLLELQQSIAGGEDLSDLAVEYSIYPSKEQGGMLGWVQKGQMCHHGMRSLEVAKWLETQGFKRIFNVAGGIHAYAVKADASIPTN